MTPGVHGSYDLRFGEPVFVPFGRKKAVALFECPVCGARYSSPDGLRKHRRNKHGRKG